MKSVADPLPHDCTVIAMEVEADPHVSVQELGVRMLTISNYRYDSVHACLTFVPVIDHSWRA